VPAYRIGCAGWGIPKAHKSQFPADGSHLQRYATRFSAVEINSSFYKPHRPGTYSRWAASVPDDFRFSAKVPKTITHKQRLIDTDTLLDSFVAEVTCLGPKLGCLLVQLPPSLAYDAPTAERFLETFRARHEGPVVVEPRHPSWFTSDVLSHLSAHRVGQVGADPAIVPEAAEPAGWLEVIYVRLHGSPQIYYSTYDEPYLNQLAARMRAYATRAREVWCVFDTTALFAATPNALSLLTHLS
jgi:uncharacterized protein YecE (DUF72 family)